MRTLGSWIGNGIEIEDKWNKIVDTQKKVSHMDSFSTLP